MANDLHLNSDSPSYYENLTSDPSDLGPKKSKSKGCLSVLATGIIFVLLIIFGLKSAQPELKGKMMALLISTETGQSLLKETVKKLPLDQNQQQSALTFLQDLRENYKNLNETKKRELHVTLGLGWEKLDGLESGQPLPKEWTQAGLILLGNKDAVENKSQTTNTKEETDLGSSSQSQNKNSSYTTEYDF